jgi:hypothetical protein
MDDDDVGGVFNKMPSGGRVTWNAILLGHVNVVKGRRCPREIFQRMQLEGV